MSEFDWMDNDEPETKAVAKPKKRRSRKRRRPVALIESERKLPLPKRMYARCVFEAPTVRAANELHRSQGYGHSASTLRRWREEPDFIDFLHELQTHYLESIGFSKEKTLVDSERVREEAMTPTPVLYQGRPVYTGEYDDDFNPIPLMETQGGVAMRAIEFQGKAVGIGGDERGGTVINLDIDFSGRRADVIVDGEVVDVE
jgi:hypothetical protein